MKTFVPVFTKDDNEFILPYSDFQNEDKILAAMTALLVIPIASQYGFTLKSGEPIEIDSENCPHISGVLTCKGASDLSIELIAGPIFDDPKGYSEANPDKCELMKEDE